MDIPEVKGKAIYEALKVLCDPGQVVELRALEYQQSTRFTCTMFGYFNDLVAMAKAAAELSPRSEGVYFTLNPVNPELLGRIYNKVRQAKTGDTTSDSHITRRRWLIIDCDVSRVAGISATDAQHEAGIERAHTVREALTAEGWPAPVLADSGNGGHLLYGIDLPGDDGGLLKRCLETLESRYGDEMVHIDTGVFNPARVCKLYGTLARKGENLEDRPHRLARIIEKPDTLEVVSLELLEALAGPCKPSVPSPQRHVQSDFDLERWIDTNIPGTRHKRTADGDVWVIPVCPFNGEHNRGEAFITRKTDDVIGAGCKHESCAWGWRELREKFEPGCYDKKTVTRKSRHREEYQADGPQDFPLTDLGNAERLIAAHGANLRYDVNRGAWLVWNSVRWEYDSDYRVDRLAANIVRSMYDLLKDADEDRRKAIFAHISKSESAPRLSAMVSLAAKLDGVAVQALSLDHDPWLLNCLNGTVDLRNGSRREHIREDLITKLAPVEYDPAATCLRWLQFLQEVFQGDADIIAFVKRMTGYFLTGDTREESVFIPTGKGQNGKTKMVETLRAILGDYAGDTPVSTFTDKRESNTADLAALMGKRLVTASEGEEAQSFNESLLKTLSGGDPITCRHLYQPYFTYTPTFKVLFSTNEIPRIRSQNFAMKRRIKLLPFRQRFYDPEDGKTPLKDSQLLPKLLAERSGILAWMVQGCLEWRERGLQTPAVIRDEVNRLFESQDPLAEFLDERCDLAPGLFAETAVLWKEYLLWCEETGRKPAFKSPSWFSRSLSQHDGIDTAKRDDVRGLQGIGIKPLSFDAQQKEESADDKDAIMDFPEKSPMKEEHEHFPKNVEMASMPSTGGLKPSVSCTKCHQETTAQNCHTDAETGTIWFYFECACGAASFYMSQSDYDTYTSRRKRLGVI